MNVSAVLATSDLNALGPVVLLAGSMAIAGALLSVFVVARRWAFIGEGISHSGLSGAGTAWLLALAFPAVFDRVWVPYVGVVVFSLSTAFAIGYLTRRSRIDSDTAIGIFLVASLAWGFLAQQIYLIQTHRAPPGWFTFFLGRMDDVSWRFSIGAALICAMVIATIALLGKEIVCYCFDPKLAEASGVSAQFIHYLLMVLVAVVIVVGVRVAGNVLVVALLVLPGATAMQLSDRLRNVIAASIVVGVLGTFTGLAVRWQWPMLLTGPCIVLALFVLFAASLIGGRLIRARS